MFCYGFHVAVLWIRIHAIFPSGFGIKLEVQILLLASLQNAKKIKDITCITTKRIKDTSLLAVNLYKKLLG